MLPRGFWKRSLAEVESDQVTDNSNSAQLTRTFHTYQAMYMLCTCVILYHILMSCGILCHILYITLCHDVLL
jgi:hypothetical protein